ncbi:type VI secretion system baseplate subunit TssK [Halopseudomonas sp.]|uniref:type VI secretion system baseplate subunit TssK n=1 Tax=Halopseudomonas sp. TaxID=2901191 RepID=UPI00311FBD27
MEALKIVWHEGMLLRPQHFQQQDRYHEQQLILSVQGLHADAWGFENLEIDEQFLAMGKLVVSKASGLLPDGSRFQLNSDITPIALDLPVSQSSTDVYLTLPLQTGNHTEIINPDHDSSLARYTATEQETRDNTGRGDLGATLLCAKPNFRLQLDADAQTGGLVRLRVCTIRETSSDGAASLDERFPATFIHCQRSPYLKRCLQEVLSLLRQRADTLAERLCARGKAAGAELGDLLSLQLINRYEAILRHHQQSSHTPAHQLFSIMLALQGELATFSAETRRPPRDLHYHHATQSQSFAALMQALRQALSNVLEQHAIELPLQQRQYGVRVAPISDPDLIDAARLVLAAKAACSSEELRSRLPNHLKVGAVEHIRQLVNLHLPGIPLVPLPVAPRQLPYHRDHCYFALEPSGDERAQLTHSGGIAFHAAGDLPDLQLALWAIRD